MQVMKKNCEKRWPPVISENQATGWLQIHKSLALAIFKASFVLEQKVNPKSIPTEGPDPSLLLSCSLSLKTYQRR
jgi:hypothetical protein